MHLTKEELLSLRSDAKKHVEHPELECEWGSDLIVYLVDEVLAGIED